MEVREECLQMRERKERKMIKKQYKDNEVSPKTYKARRAQIEQWVNVERHEIEKSKLTFEEQW